MADALVLVHCQTGFLDGSAETGPVADAAGHVRRLRTLMAGARTAGAPIVFLEETSAPDVDGPIHPTLAPEPGDVVVRTHGPDVFGSAHLGGTLEAVGADGIVVAGFQTEMCIAATVEGAASRGLSVTVVSDTHGTFDGPDEPPAADVVATHNERFAGVARLVVADEVAWGVSPGEGGGGAS